MPIILLSRYDRRWLLLELWVDLYLISRYELVGFVGHPDDGHHFFKHGIGHTFVLRRNGVARNAVSALVGYANGDVDHFFCQRVERAGSHDLLDRFPSALERSGIVPQRLPEIIDEIGFARSANVVVDGPNFRRRVFVFDEAEGRHGVSLIHHSGTESQRSLF
jgi:hypothetical protein